MLLKELLQCKSGRRGRNGIPPADEQPSNGGGGGGADDNWGNAVAVVVVGGPQPSFMTSSHPCQSGEG